MPRARACVPAHSEHIYLDYLAHLAVTGRGDVLSGDAARQFLARFPDLSTWASRPLVERMRSNDQARGFVMYLMTHGLLHPGYDFLLARKMPSIWREVALSPMREDLERFRSAAQGLGFSRQNAQAVGSQVIARLLIETGKPLRHLAESDLADLAEAGRAREHRRGVGWAHYAKALFTARQVLYHLGILGGPPPSPTGASRWGFERRMAGVPDALRPSFVSYLERQRATRTYGTITAMTTHLSYFGRHLSEVDPGITSLCDLDRKRHIESYLVAVADARSSRDGGPLSPSERRARVLAVSAFLNSISEWGWPEAPPRRLVFRSDIPKIPRPLPRYLPPDDDRRLVQALESSKNRLYADALLLQRACGLRIGELCDLELDCVHEVPGQGAWLKVPLGKLDTERMVPLDEETLAIIDRIVEHRSHCRPLPHPRTARPTEFLLTHHGRRVSANALRDELTRAAGVAGLAHATPHQLRHTYATALVNAGVSLQSLMVLLGHTSAEMSLRYGRLFDATVREEYERALTLAKSRMGPILPTSAPVELHTNWREAPAIKARLAGGYCLRAEAQGACAYANICEHCPNFRSDPSHLAVLTAQRIDTEALAADAERRGWVSEADRHRRLIERLDVLMARSAAR